MTHPGQLLKQHKLYAGKELGQNFLSDPNTANRIVEKSGISKDTHVLEIGSGLGALTIPIARAAASVTAVEKDPRLIPLLQQQLADNDLQGVEIINSDVLKVDLERIARGRKLLVIGNLPYNISSQILFRLVEERAIIEKAVLMFQKELAKRILAPPGGRDYSRLSAVVQYASDISFVANIGPSAFFPRPEVDSTILAFQFFETAELDKIEEKRLFEVIKAAFSKRRKSLKNSLSGTSLGFEKETILTILDTAGIDAKRRAETLDVTEFISLTRAVSAVVNMSPNGTRP